MIKLANGCTCSEPKVYPSTWERSNASLKKSWYIFYRFYDPKCRDQYPNGKLIKIAKLNTYKTIAERQDAVRTLMENDLYMLKERDWNPITRTSKPAEDQVYVVHPSTAFIAAIEKALELSHMQEDSKADIKSTLKFVKIASDQLRYSDMPVSEVRRRHIKAILEQCGRMKNALR